MQKTIDTLSSVTDWTASTGASIYGVTDDENLIAGDQASSLVLNFSEADSYCEKVFSEPIDTTGYTDITIWAWSRNLKKLNNQFRSSADFSYKIDFGTGKEFYLPCYSTFNCFTISTADVATIERIRVTATTGTEDYLILSYAVLSRDDLPLDLFTAIQTKLQNDISENYSDKYLIGSVTVSAGSREITLSGKSPWIERYCPITITDGVNTERRTVRERSGGNFILDQPLTYSYSGANVYLHFPVVFGRRQTEIELPSITVWGLNPEKIYLNSQLEKVLDSWNTDDTFSERREGHFQKYTVMIDCEARQDEILSLLSRVARDTIGRQKLWVNGQKIDIEFNGPSTEIDPPDGIQIIPKVQYLADVTIKEELYKRNKIYKTTTINTTTEIG